MAEQPSTPPAPTPRTEPYPGTEWRPCSQPGTDLPFPTGRHLLHDPRSRDWDAKDLLPAHALTSSGAAAMPTVDQWWPRHCTAWDQGSLRSCTTNAALGLMMTEPYYSLAIQRAQAKYWAGATGRVVNGIWQFLENPDCTSLYSYETQLDNSEIPGSWPPNDTGSTGLWSMKTLQAYNLITSYYHAFDLATALSWVANNGPISVGSNWYDSMYYPSSDGTVSISPNAALVGMHQYEILGVYPADNLVHMANQYGTNWGLGGNAFMSYDTLGRLLSEGGDVVVPVL